MRKLLIAILLGSSAAAAAVAQEPQHEKNATRAERKQAHETRSNRPAPPKAAQGTRARHMERNAPTTTAQRTGPQHVYRNAAPAAAQHTRPAHPERNAAPAQPRQVAASAPNELRRRPPPVSQRPRFGTQPPVRVHRQNPAPGWNTNWRHNNRYNWQDWRRRHGSVYRVGRYHDPFGWGYQLFSIGWRLWPGYYGSAYWINDPWMYRLPPAPPGTRWIRYYNDALLVDMWSGEVIDVIHGFFW